MSGIPSYRDRLTALAAFRAGQCPRWVYVDGWHVDLLAPEPDRAPVAAVEPYDHTLAASVVAMACGVRWAGLSDDDQVRIVALVDEIWAIARGP